MTRLRQRMIDDMTLHGLKPKTIRAYVTCVARFGRHFGKSPALAGISASRPLWPAFRQVARTFGNCRDPILPALPHP